jgi:hypothetical protein
MLLGKLEVEAILTRVPNTLRWPEVLTILLPCMDGCATPSSNQRPHLSKTWHARLASIPCPPSLRVRACA